MALDLRTVTREFYETESYYGHPTPNMNLKAPSVSKVNIEAVIKDMESRGLSINKDLSEKEVLYSSGGTHKKATVPLDSQFEKSAEVTGIILRHDVWYANLEIIIRDYDKSEVDNPDVIGGNVTIECGIYCKIDYKGPQEHENLVDITESVVKKHYGRFGFLMSDKDKQIAKTLKSVLKEKK
jgi:hypothetical protein